MTLGEQIIIARKKKGMKAYELASMIDRSTAVMSDIENDKLKGSVSPELLTSIADVLNAPEILLQHCRECPVRQHVLLQYCPESNDILNDSTLIVSKLRMEMQAAINVVTDLSEQYMKVDFKDKPECQDSFTEMMEQVLDVERGIEALKFELVLNQLRS